MRVVGIGKQDFADVRKSGIFYIDKTHFIKTWWDNQDSVTLITRPRRFGKTLALSMTEAFFSLAYAGEDALFEGLSIWEDEQFRSLQGTFPVISLSFSTVKETSFAAARERIYQLLTDLYSQHEFLMESGILTEKERQYFCSVNMDMSEVTATMSLHRLSQFLTKYYGKKVLLLLDEYDTPMQEAYACGYWEQLTSFIRNLFNASFKTNPYMERALMTGITRVSRESVFSDLNNLVVVTTTSDLYADCFGFTEAEVKEALKEYRLSGEEQNVKTWYDGFCFGRIKSIYNPWSILNYLKTGKFEPYWANTSSNNLIGTLMKEGSKEIKLAFESLLQGETLRTNIDEQIVYSQLDQDETAVFSLLLAAGYLKVKQKKEPGMSAGNWEPAYDLELTNLEVKLMFQNLIRRWFGPARSDYNDFIKALLADDVEAMNEYMNRVALNTFSFFDTGNRPSKKMEPERFYHGFVLGLIVDLEDRYHITSNRESGFGRYDIMLEPKKDGLNAVILEFKVRSPVNEEELSDTVHAALTQIEQKKYKQKLIAKGFPEEEIRCYGFAFEGKNVLIG